MSNSCLGFVQRTEELLDVFCTYCFYYEIFNSSHYVNNLAEVTKLIISQRRHSHPNPPLLKVTENLPAPNTAPKQRRGLRFFIINLHFTALWWMSLFKVMVVRPRALLTAPEEIPWRGHLWLNGEAITRKCILSLFASFEAIQQEKQGDTQTPVRFLKGISKCTVSYGLVVSHSLRVRGHTQGPPPGTGNVKPHKTSGPRSPTASTALAWATETTKTEENYATNSSSERKGERWSKRSVTKAGCRVQLKHWGCCTQTKEQHWTILGFSPVIFPTFMQIAPA